MTNFDKILAVAQQRQGLIPTIKPQEGTVHLEFISEREQDTRTLNPKHVESLADSISVLGLIEPLVLDKKGKLLAGGHRLAAIKFLKQERLESYLQHFPNDSIPVRILDFEAEQNPDLALQIEIAENEQRKDYTSTEVKAIAARLKSAGYVYLKGRPKEGQKALMPALAIVVGKHLRTVQRYLNEEAEPISTKSTTSVVLLRQALPKLKQWLQNDHVTSKEKSLAKQLVLTVKLIEEVLQVKR